MMLLLLVLIAVFFVEGRDVPHQRQGGVSEDDHQPWDMVLPQESGEGNITEDWNSAIERADNRWSNINENACMKCNDYLKLSGLSIQTCRQRCQEHTGCRSITYNIYTQTCAFSGLGSDSRFYSEPCHLQGYCYTEKLPEPICGICPPGFSPLGSQCFMLVQERKNWNDARSYCQRKSADLAQPNDFEALRQFTYDHAPPNVGFPAPWIGARKEGGISTWLNGTEVNGIKESQDGCILYNASSLGQWIHISSCLWSEQWFYCEAR